MSMFVRISYRFDIFSSKSCLRVKQQPVESKLQTCIFRLSSLHSPRRFCLVCITAIPETAHWGASSTSLWQHHHTTTASSNNTHPAGRQAILPVRLLFFWPVSSLMFSMTKAKICWIQETSELTAPSYPSYPPQNPFHKLWPKKLRWNKTKPDKMKQKRS